MEELKNQLGKVCKDLTKEELDRLFPELAYLFIKNYGIQAKGCIYLLNEIEFYFYGPNYDDIRKDSKTQQTITYKRNSEAGCWFIHDYGVDLTFKSEDKANAGYGGGILIRSIERKDGEKTITGPKNCVNELWEESVDAFSETAPNPKIVRLENVRDAKLDAATIRITVGKNDPWKSKWRFTVAGKKVSPLKD